jgi:2-methylisocitrate lyase-like PEP mutase family enzyme
MAGQSIEQRATPLLGPHHPGNPVVLPTGWDAWSARLATDAGFAALAVGGHPSFFGG